MDIKEQLKDIKTQLRLSMNGAVSQSMTNLIRIILKNISNKEVELKLKKIREFSKTIN